MMPYPAQELDLHWSLSLSANFWHYIHIFEGLWYPGLPQAHLFCTSAFNKSCRMHMISQRYLQNIGSQKDLLTNWLTDANNLQILEVKISQTKATKTPLIQSKFLDN